MEVCIFRLRQSAKDYRRLFNLIPPADGLVPPSEASFIRIFTLSLGYFSCCPIARRKRSARPGRDKRSVYTGSFRYSIIAARQ